MGEGTFVRPLAFYPIALLLLLLLIQLMRGGTQFPRAGALTPLAGFVLVVLLASSYGAWLDPLSLRGQEYLGRLVRAWATLAIGLSFFIAAVWMNRNEDDLKFSVKWILAGFALDIAWSGVQALAFYTPLIRKVTVTHWQLAFSMRELVKTNRISGMAYEPAWLAGQIATVHLPWLFASLLTGVRFTRFKWLEPILLGFAVLLILATYSRGGLLTAGTATVLTFLLVGRAEIRAAGRWFVSGFQHGGNWIVRMSMVVLVLAALAGATLFLGQKGYMARLFASDAESLEEFIVENSAGARSAYLISALGVYEESPILGVGLGASGFYMYDRLPDWSLTVVPEIARQLSPESRLYPNPKNMYARLLAETGLVGLILFAAFLFSLLGDALAALQNRSPLSRFLGTAGLFAWIAIAIYNVTQDSFATPNVWINLGILAGMTAQAGKLKESSIIPAPFDKLGTLPLPEGEATTQELS
jgi:O-antigen ligase